MSRTLLVTNDFPPRIGGIEAFAAAVCRMLDDEVVVLTSHQPGDRAFDAQLRFPVVRTGRLLLPTQSVARRAVRLLAEHGADRVVFGAAAPLGLLAPALRAAGATRLVALTHGHEVWWAQLPGARTVLRRIGEAVDHLTVISDYTGQRIAVSLSPAARSALLRLPPPVDLDSFTPMPDAVVPGRCLAAGRLVRQKGFATLLRAWSALPSVVGAVRPELMVVGDGPDRRRLARLADRLGVPANFVGPRPHAAMPELYASAQVVALPVRTRWGGLNPEGLGLGFVEAAACGRPVLVGRSGGAPETVRDGVSGYLLDPDDLAGWTGRLHELLADRSRADTMGVAGRVHVRGRFDLPAARQVLRRALGLPLP